VSKAVLTIVVLTMGIACDAEANSGRVIWELAKKAASSSTVVPKAVPKTLPPVVPKSPTNWDELKQAHRKEVGRATSKKGIVIIRAENQYEWVHMLVVLQTAIKRNNYGISLG
jgi:uncharacterized protein YbaP (TraB family)